MRKDRNRKEMIGDEVPEGRVAGGGCGSGREITGIVTTVME